MARQASRARRTAPGGTAASATASPSGARSRNAPSATLSPAPSYRVRSETGAMGFDRVNSAGAMLGAAGVGERMFSAATDPTRRVDDARIGWTYTRRRPSGDGVTKKSEAPEMRSFGRAEGRPAHARAT